MILLLARDSDALVRIAVSANSNNVQTGCFDFFTIHYYISLVCMESIGPQVPYIPTKKEIFVRKSNTSGKHCATEKEKKRKARRGQVRMAAVTCPMQQHQTAEFFPPLHMKETPIANCSSRLHIILYFCYII